MHHLNITVYYQRGLPNNIKSITEILSLLLFSVLQSFIFFYIVFNFICILCIMKFECILYGVSHMEVAHIIHQQVEVPFSCIQTLLRASESFCACKHQRTWQEGIRLLWHYACLHKIQSKTKWVETAFKCVTL